MEGELAECREAAEDAGVQGDHGYRAQSDQGRRAAGTAHQLHHEARGRHFGPALVRWNIKREDIVFHKAGKPRQQE